MFDHQDQSIIPTTVAREPMYVSTVVLYSLAYDAADIIDNANHATELSAQILISIADKHGQKTISRAYSLSQKMGYYL